MRSKFEELGMLEMQRQWDSRMADSALIEKLRLELHWQWMCAHAHICGLPHRDGENNWRVRDGTIVTGPCLQPKPDILIQLDDEKTNPIYDMSSAD